MNPFDLSGPEFLVFYVVYIAVIFIAAEIYWRVRTARPEAPLPTNPYEIAYLRGGAREAARVAVMGLVGRGIIKQFEGRQLQVAKERATRLPDPFERRTAEFFGTRRLAGDKALTAFVQEPLRSLAAKLESAGLMLDGKLRGERVLLTLAVVAALWLMAGIKIAVALGRGRTNIGFLILLASVASIAAIVMFYRTARTRAGGRALSALTNLNRRPVGTGSNFSEVMLYAAIFGVAATQLEANPYYRKPNEGGESGSGCGSSSGDSGGSSCGGGSGCGGCGGGGGD